MSGAVGTLSVLDGLGLISPIAGTPISLADLAITFRDGGSGRTQTLALGSTAFDLASGGSSLFGPAPMTVAAVTEKREDPCEKDGSLSLR